MTQLQDAPASQTTSIEWSSEDVGNIIALEHVNARKDSRIGGGGGTKRGTTQRLIARSGKAGQVSFQTVVVLRLLEHRFGGYCKVSDGACGDGSHLTSQRGDVPFAIGMHAIA